MPNIARFQTLYVTSGDPTTVNEVTPYAAGQLGAKCVVRNTGGGTGDQVREAKVFQYVQVDSTTTVAPFKGAVAWWSDKTNFKVTTATTNRGQVAGVFAGFTPNIGNFGFIQIGGTAIVKFIDGVTSTPDATGKLVIPSATAGKADCLAAGSAATYPILGRSDGTYVAPLAEGPVALDLGELEIP